MKPAALFDGLILISYRMYGNWCPMKNCSLGNQIVDMVFVNNHNLFQHLENRNRWRRNESHLFETLHHSSQ